MGTRAMVAWVQFVRLLSWILETEHGRLGQLLRSQRAITAICLVFLAIDEHTQDFIQCHQTAYHSRSSRPFGSSRPHPSTASNRATALKSQRDVAEVQEKVS